MSEHKIRKKTKEAQNDNALARTWLGVIGLEIVIFGKIELNTTQD